MVEVESGVIGVRGYRVEQESWQRKKQQRTSGGKTESRSCKQVDSEALLTSTRKSFRAELGARKGCGTDALHPAMSLQVDRLSVTTGRARYGL